MWIVDDGVPGMAQFSPLRNAGASRYCGISPATVTVTVMVKIVKKSDDGILVV